MKKKILIISDSHGCFDKFYTVCKTENPNTVLFLGDYTKDAYELQSIFPNTEFYIVRGNCDYGDYESKIELCINILNYKIFITHGHEYGVKRNYLSLEKRARDLEVDIALFGHTHVPYKSKKEGLYIFNPGALVNNDYGVMYIKNNNLIIEHKKI